MRNFQRKTLVFFTGGLPEPCTRSLQWLHLLYVPSCSLFHQGQEVTRRETWGAVSCTGHCSPRLPGW